MNAKRMAPATPMPTKPKAEYHIRIFRQAKATEKNGTACLSGCNAITSPSPTKAPPKRPTKAAQVADRVKEGFERIIALPSETNGSPNRDRSEVFAPATR